MAYESGTATNYLDLLAKLKTFVTANAELVSLGQNWSILEQSSTHAVFKAPGLSGTEEIYLSIHAFGDVTNDYYNWGLNGSVGYSAGTGYWGQPYLSSTVYTYLWNSPIPYWFVANGQRLIMVAKVSTTYQSIYIGKYLPYCLPSQYPYPVFISGGDNQSNARWSKDNEDIGSFQCPRRGSKMFYMDSTWKTVMNAHDQGDYLQWDPNGVNVWPTSYPSQGSDHNITQSTLAFADGGYALLPFILNMDTPAINVLGELDGVFWVTGHQNASENVITIGADNYLVVQDVFRTGKENYFALRLK